MKKTCLSFFLCCTFILNSQTVKSKILKLKYFTPENWSVQEFGGPNSWDEKGNELCRCSGLIFSKPDKTGKYNVVVYPITPSGMDSTKREFVGSLHFENVQKIEKTTNKHFAFEKRRSNFYDVKTKKVSYPAIRYIAKVDDHYYIIYAWKESMDLLNSTAEKELTEMVNAIEPL